MYTLERYKTIASRHECPQCHRKRCFSYYVDDEGKGLSPLVGRCEHINKCGYHYKPKDFFADHPSLEIPPSWRLPIKDKERKLWTIDAKEVDRFRSNDSTLCKWLESIFGKEAVRKVADKYCLGALIDGSSIFWQIDTKGQVRTGKVMAYGNDGHRIKGDVDRINWMHSLLKRDRLLPDEFELTQCLFGEHLINNEPEKTIAIVESEKTAIIMELFDSDYVWIATGGCNNLSSERLAAFKGRKIVAFPDADVIAEWDKRVKELSRFYDIRLATISYTQDDVEHKRDIADLILKR